MTPEERRKLEIDVELKRRGLYPDAPIEQDNSPQLTQGQAAVQGGIQGLTYGLGDELAAGLKTGYDNVASLWRDTPAKTYAKNLDFIRSYRDAATKQFPNTTTAADMAGSIAGAGGAYKALGTLAPKTLIGNSIAGAIDGVINAYGRADTADEFLGNAPLDIALGVGGGAGGHALGEVIGRTKRVKDFVPDTLRNKQAEKLGIELTPAQIYDDRALHKVEASMRSDPGASKAFEGMDMRNQTQANRIASRAMGKESPVITEIEMGDISKNITKKFKSATESGDSILLDGQWADDLDLIEAGYKKLPGKSNKSVGVINDLRQISKDFYISPSDYQSYYSSLGKDLEKAANAGDGNLVSVYRKLRGALDSVTDRSAVDLSAEFNDARQLYKAKMLIQKPGVLHTETGDISPLSLANKLRADTRGYVEGGNNSDLYNLARVSQAKKSGIGDSGTATRSKTALDYLQGPINESLANTYLGSKLGTSYLGPSSGLGAPIGLPMSSGLLSLFENKERQQGLIN